MGPDGCRRLKDRKGNGNELSELSDRLNLRHFLRAVSWWNVILVRLWNVRLLRMRLCV